MAPVSKEACLTGRIGYLVKKYALGEENLFH